tara:strand:- start:10465 stop:10734 length:270 start_codon:yes stop_codon:yes gene_type:complete
MKRPTAILKTDEIKNSVNQYQLKNWINATFTNTGESPVEIQGILYKTGETYDAGAGPYEVECTISIRFKPDTVGQTQCVVVNYAVLKCN